MICKNCNNKEICVIVEFAQAKSNIVTVEIQSCLKYQPIGYQQKQEEAAQASGISPLMRAERIRSIKPMEKVEELEPEASDAEVTSCIDCGNTTTISKVCDRCGAPVCDDCATVDMLSSERLCDKCWSEEG